MTEAVETLAEMPERPRRKIMPWKVSEGFVAALPIIILLIIGFAGPMVLVLVYSFMPRGSFSVTETPSLENYVDIVEQNFYISFSWSLFLAFISVVILLIVCYPLAIALRRIQGTPVPPAHAADRGAALRRREHPAAGLGALLRQERLPRRCAQGGDGPRDREPGQQRAGHRLRHLLYLPALHAVPDPAWVGQRADRGARSGL